MFQIWILKMTGLDSGQGQEGTSQAVTIRAESSTVHTKVHQEMCRFAIVTPRIYGYTAIPAAPDLPPDKPGTCPECPLEA